MTKSARPQQKPNFSRYRPFKNLLPRKFITDGGQVFDVEVVKPTIASFHINLIKDGQLVNKIKVSRLNPRLRYKVNNQLLTPEQVSDKRKESTNGTKEVVVTHR